MNKPSSPQLIGKCKVTVFSDVYFDVTTVKTDNVVYGIVKLMREIRSKQRGSRMCCSSTTDELIYGQIKHLYNKWLQKQILSEPINRKLDLVEPIVITIA